MARRHVVAVAGNLRVVGGQLRVEPAARPAELGLGPGLDRQHRREPHHPRERCHGHGRHRSPVPIGPPGRRTGTTAAIHCRQHSSWTGFSSPGAMVYVTADFAMAYHRACCAACPSLPGRGGSRRICSVSRTAHRLRGALSSRGVSAMCDEDLGGILRLIFSAVGGASAYTLAYA